MTFVKGMIHRFSDQNSLDFFPTPPYATRALFEVVFPILDIKTPLKSVLEPACGQGHMSEVLKEYAESVLSSDICDYDYGGVSDFLNAERSKNVDWVITNPPFNLASSFLLKSIQEAQGVCLLTRIQWTEGKARYREIFSRYPPEAVCVFSERVAMVKGRWDPDATSAMSYAWMVWRAPFQDKETRFIWIPPGQKERLTKPDDERKFAGESFFVEADTLEEFL